MSDERCIFIRGTVATGIIAGALILIIIGSTLLGTLWIGLLQ